MRSRHLASLVAVSAVAALVPALAPATANAANRPLAQYEQQKLSWHRCSAESPARLQCADITVPLDYAKPNGKKIKVAISRIKATSPEERRGVLLLNPGGPGAPGLEMPVPLERQLPESVKSRYDLIGFDPRGVGHSSPVSCGLTSDEENFQRQYKPATFAKDVAWARTVARKCKAKQGDKLHHITTRNTARDLDVIRAVLGEKKISYLGYSYGTYLGAVYTQMFPSRTDRFVLDSAVDPQRIWRGMIQVWAEGTEPAFDRWTEWTAKRHEEFKLGDTPRKVRTTFWNLVKQADKKPINLNGVPVTADEIRSNNRPAFFEVRQAATKIAELKQAATGRKAKLPRVPRSTPRPTPPRFGGVPGDNGTASFWAVLCSDARNWPRDPEQYRRDAIRDKARYPLYGDFASNIMPCAFLGPGQRAHHQGQQQGPRAHRAKRVGPADPPDQRQGRAPRAEGLPHADRARRRGPRRLRQGVLRRQDHQQLPRHRQAPGPGPHVPHASGQAAYGPQPPGPGTDNRPGPAPGKLNRALP